ncbi:MAG: hypothetical protein VSS52_000175 [Thiotrichaceae bacterium]|nr:hypothetical protein [Thiotrichaceae bacterium]
MNIPTKKQLLTINIISGLLLIPFPILFIGSIFLFDAPGAENGIINNLIYFSIVTYPISFLFSVTGTWLGYKFGRNRIAWYMSLLPFLNVLAFFIGVAIMIFVCNGSLICY